jgi:predicted short-subunit dehydrogenase-like oxidoreductase (DUF2520 family)
MRLNIIGCGRAGGTVASALQQTGRVEIGQILNRSRDSAATAVDRLGAGEPIEKPGDFASADLWLISTSDGAIATTADRLADEGPGLAGAVVFHLSGRFGPEVLDLAGRAGAHTASVHPVRSMPRFTTRAEEFAGTICIAEGAPAALDLLGPLFISADAGWNEVGGLDRGLYHAALAIISNVTKGVIWKAQHWLEVAGLDSETAAAVSHSLLSITTEDVFREGVRHSITGPVVRGDTSTVEAHIEALKRVGRHDAEVYRVLARTVLDLASERGDLDDEVLRRFEILLGDAAR